MHSDTNGGKRRDWDWDWDWDKNKNKNLTRGSELENKLSQPPAHLALLEECPVGSELTVAPL